MLKEIFQAGERRKKRYLNKLGKTKVEFGTRIAWELR